MRLVDFKVQLDRETDNRLREWADAEDRKKTPHAGRLMRRLAALRETHPQELERLGLLEPKGARA